MKTLNSGCKILFIALLICSPLLSEKKTDKFGKLSIADLQTTVCPIDSGAHAYFIFDHGESRFTYPETRIVSNQQNSKGFQLQFSRHFRLKICDNQAYDWANIEIPLYQSGSDSEKIMKLKAYTYNLVDGKLVKTKLEKKDLISEETSDNWKTYKAALPNVREGSIIEVEYIVTSEFFFNLRKWDFQYSIPVLESEYEVAIPEYFHYNQTHRGYLPIETNKKEGHEKLTLTYVQRAEGAGQQAYTSVQEYDYLVEHYHYSLQNAPAFPRAKYLKTSQNYLSKVSFELSYTKFPNVAMNEYTTSWEEINDDLLKSHSFGDELKRGGHLKDIVEELQATNLAGEDLASAAFDKIKESLVWNDYASIYPKGSLSSAFKSGSGNCADINLNLVLLFRKLGLKAFPVILSTRKHGVIYPVHPSITSFNYVIAQINIDGKVIVYDATDEFSVPNLLPVRCLNDKGFVISNYGGTWLDLVDHQSYSYQQFESVKLTAELNFVGTKNIKVNGYAAYLNKQKIKAFGSIDEYRESLSEKSEDIDVDTISIKGLDSKDNRLVISYPYNKTNCVNIVDDIVYFQPLMNPFVDTNPFQLKERKYPVEYNYPYNVMQTYSYQIPEGYTVSEIPKSISTRLEGDGLSYRYQLSTVGNLINLTVLFKINKSTFLPEEYPALKQVYQNIIDKQKEMVVLKKIQ